MTDPLSALGGSGFGGFDARRSPLMNRGPQQQRQMTIGDLLLENRIIFLAGPIMDESANLAVMKLLYLQSENRKQDVHLYVNSAPAAA